VQHQHQIDQLVNQLAAGGEGGGINPHAGGGGLQQQIDALNARMNNVDHFFTILFNHLNIPLPPQLVQQ
jgi:hypothetical protein